MNKLEGVYENNKPSGLEALKNISYGIGEALFSSSSCSDLTDFTFNFIANNLENIGDVLQFDIDQINLKIQIKIYNKEIIKLNEVQQNEQ